MKNPSKPRRLCRVFTPMVVLFITRVVLAGGPHPDCGLYAIWADADVQNLPYITGGQIVLQWQELHPAQGRFDFAALDARMQELHARGRKTTIQINGNRKPGWLYDKVPYHPKKFTIQISSGEKGSLMYWHPAHVQAYTDFLRAWANHMRQSPYRQVVLGIRQNFNAMGTEHHGVPEENRSLDQWITPPGVDPGTVWTQDAAHEYDRIIVSAFIKYFSNDFSVFVRNNIADQLRAPFRTLWDNGTLAWFHTSTEAEPRAVGTERQYLTFLEYCKTGKTVGYAESWADAWGFHGGIQDPRWCSPPQWNYWRLLCDLHCGVSFIAVYGDDLRVALNGTHRGKQYPQYISEFDQAFRFAAQYAGYAAYPVQSPGAWIAFRHSTVNLNYNRPLESVTGDYTFHMQRLNDVGTIERNVGPDDQRFGAWALKLPVGEDLRIAVDEIFLGSFQNQAATLNVIYLDRGTSMLEISLANEHHRQQLADSGEWKTATFPLEQRPLKNEGIVTLRCNDGPVYLHMVRIEMNE